MKSSVEGGVKDLSRRRFLSGIATAGTGLAAAAVLGGCSSSASGEPAGNSGGSNWRDIQWKEETDILVAGSGMVLFAALYGHMQGESVLVVEKNSFLGGTASLSGGGVWLPMNALMSEPDNREDAFNTIKKVAEGVSSDELINAFLDGSESFSAWASEELGFPWLDPLAPNPAQNPFIAPAGTAWDRYQAVDGYRPGRALVVDTEKLAEEGDFMSGGPAMFRFLRSKVEEVGLPYKLDTAVKRLITDDNGQVIGVEVEEGANSYYIKAKKAVILATGGFDHDAEMRKNYLRCPIFNTVALTSNTGDGIKMGLELGADLAQMQSTWGCGAWLPIDRTADPETDFYAGHERYDGLVERCKPGSIIVNKHGLRFGNESSNYAIWNRVYEAWDAGADHYEQTWPGYLIVDASFMEHYPLPLAAGQIGVIPDDAVQADSLEELASTLSIDWRNLSWQIEQFNKFAEEGFDPQFHRGENDWDTYPSAGGDNAGRTDLANPSMAPIQTPPFVAMTVYPGTLGTKGGLKTNGKAQVLKTDGSIIPRLYASGGGANCALGEGYPSCGGVLGNGAVTGFNAMVDAMTQTQLSN